MEDLTGRFLDSYDPQHERIAVEQYPHYFPGPIIISCADSKKYIIEGQQRLTSLTRFLIYLRQLQIGRGDAVKMDEMISSKK